MAMESLLLPILLSLLSTATVAAIPFHQGIIATVAPLDPTQSRALQTMNIPISNTNPCSDQAVLCDNSFPFRNITSLRLRNCSYNLSVSPTPLECLSNITTLELINCPFNLQSNSTPLLLIVEKLKNLTSLTISYSNLNESLPEKWDNSKLTHIDLSNNQLTGQIPNSLGNLVCLETLSLASNLLYGDVPRFTRYIKDLRYLNLKNNSFKNDTCENEPSSGSKAVLVMAYILSMWIIFILFVMLLANCT